MSWLSKIFGKDKGKQAEQPPWSRGSAASSELQTPSVEDVTFDTTDFELGGVHERVRAWRNKDGDAVILFYETCPPDYPVGKKDIDEFFNAAAEEARSNSAPRVEQYVCDLDGHRGLAYIMRGMIGGRIAVYQGDISIPFKSHYYHFRIECKEHGPTGVRESLAIADAHFEGRLRDGEDGKVTIGGDVNPDDRKYDEMFPAHPLSRMRTLIEHVISTVSTDEKLGNFEPYVWPKEVRQSS